jgi:hypothetical protein
VGRGGADVAAPRISRAVPGVIDDLMKRYSKRQDSIGIAIRPNPRKCFPTLVEIPRTWFSPDRRAFHVALHNAEGLNEFRTCNPPSLNPVLLFARRCSSTVASHAPPAKWEDHQANPVIRANPEGPDALRLSDTSLATRMRRTAWMIAHNFYHRIREGKWTECAISVLSAVVRFTRRLEMSQHAELTEYQEAAGYARAGKDVGERIESWKTQLSPRHVVSVIAYL